jgi:hypothetical protein
LWMEVLHSDEGQLAWMKGYAHGVQQADLEARGFPQPRSTHCCAGFDQSWLDDDRRCGLPDPGSLDQS